MPKPIATPWRIFERLGSKTLEIQARGTVIIPWIGFNSCDLTWEKKVANARFIVRAVNAHEPMKAALEGLVTAIEADALMPDSCAPLKAARAALARANAEVPHV